jgi:hypothetical protein
MNLYILLVFVTHLNIVLSETVGVNGNLYADTGKSSSSCTRHVTVEGEGDCYYSLKRLISGTGISNMNARGMFTRTNGEFVKYENANNDGQWELSSVDKVGIATSQTTAPTSRLHVSGEIRSARPFNLYAADQRLMQNIRNANITNAYKAVRKLKVRDFEYHPAYEAATNLGNGATTVRSIVTQETSAAIPGAVKTSVGQEKFGEVGTQNGFLEVDKMEQIIPGRVFYDLLASFQQLANQHDQLQKQVNDLQAELKQHKKDTADNFNSAKNDRLNLREILSKTQSDHLSDDNDMEDKIATERNERIRRDDEITKQLDYVSQVFSTYTNY